MVFFKVQDNQRCVSSAFYYFSHSPSVYLYSHYVDQRLTLGHVTDDTEHGQLHCTVSLFRPDVTDGGVPPHSLHPRLTMPTQRGDELR